MVHALVMTAHHDDAVLWMGGAIQRTLTMGWHWTVLALCVPEPARRTYFNAYCTSLGVDHATWQFRDYQGPQPFTENSKQQMEQAILEHCGTTQYDWVFTHSKDDDCEYGSQANHIEIRDVTKSLVGCGSLTASASRLVHFSYRPEFGFNGRATVARLDADFHLQLTYNELLQKCAWCMSAPDAHTNLNNLGNPCPNPESFSGAGIQLPQPFIPR